ncbi:MAG UNVERIFIED_CONTAM: hypothetical protein LVR18_35685 [Planctomycetaceae bacterium]
MLPHSRRLAAFLLALACPAILEADDLNSLQGRLEQIEADNRQLREELADLQARESLLATPVLSVQEHSVAAPLPPLRRQTIQKRFQQNGTTASKLFRRISGLSTTSVVGCSSTVCFCQTAPGLCRHWCLYRPGRNWISSSTIAG